MPREQVEWFVKQSLHDDDDKLHARQYCTYYSIVNVNKNTDPYSRSFEQEQTWTLSRTMSSNNKRYQSSIENIHLTIPSVLTINPKKISNNYENINMKLDQPISILPPLPPSRQSVLSSQRLNRINMDSKVQQQNNSNSKTKKSRKFTNPMRIMHVNGEFIVRI